MGKTAVNWLVDEFVKIGILNAHILLKKQISTEDAINKAKEMEKAQIMTAYIKSYNKAKNCSHYVGVVEFADNYFNETFKPE